MSNLNNEFGHIDREIAAPNASAFPHILSMPDAASERTLPALGFSATAKSATAKSAAAKSATAMSMLLLSGLFPTVAEAQQGVTLDPVDVEARRRQQQQQAAPAPVPQASDFNPTPTAQSPKMTAPLLNTPQTVTIVPEAIIQERGATTLTEVLRNTPGITFDAGENGFASSTNHFKLRGFNASGDVFVDGSRDNGNFARDTFNTERVEIFKGPAADNGRGSAGGYVNIVTKTPKLENFTAGEISYGFDEYNSSDRKRTTLDVNRIIGPNTALRINGMWQDGGVAGREIAQQDAYGFAPSIAFGLGTDKRAVFSYEHLKRHDLPDWGVPGAMIKGLITYNPLTAGANRQNFYGLRSDFDDVTSDVALARFEYDITKNSTLSNQTRWSRVERNSLFTTTRAFVNPNVQTQNMGYGRENTTLTNLTNYSSEFFVGNFKHNLAAGIELSREESKGKRFEGFPTAAPFSPTNIFNPNPDRVISPLATYEGNTGTKINTIAAYAYDTIHLNRQWQLNGGIRVEHYNAKISSKNLIGGSIGNFDGLSLSETTVGGKLGIVYKPVDTVSYYAAVGVSHQPPGSYLSNPDISRREEDGDDVFPNLIPGADPVRSINYEIGVKQDHFNGRLSTTAALFHTDKRVPITGCTPAGGSPPSCAAGPNPVRLMGYGNQIAQGLELGIAGNLSDHWKVFGGFLWMKTEKKFSRELELARISAQPTDYNVVPFTTFRGDELSFAPEFSANLWTTYRVPQTPWTVGGGVQYVGSSYVGRPDDAGRIIPNGRFGKLPDYFLTHLMAQYEIRKDVEIRLNVDNVFDKTYAVSTNWPATRAILGAPRTYRLSASFKY